MRKLKIYFSILLFAVIISLCNIPNVSAATNPYKQNGPYGTNCTWYAWKQAYERAGIALPGFGNAKDWYSDAQKAGYTVGTTPKANSIVVWGEWTEYGHVGYVEKVDSEYIYVWDSTGGSYEPIEPEYSECMANSVCEATDKECDKYMKVVARKYSLNNPRYKVTGYIYLSIAPKTTTTTTTQSNNIANKNTNTTNSNTNSTPKPSVSKSSNNYLKSITLDIGELSFDKETTIYNLEVEYEVDNITVNAEAEDSKATITGIGEHKLEVGENQFKIDVTAEDGTTKEYAIAVTRKEEIIEEVQETPETNEVNTAKEGENKNINYTLFIIVGVAIVFILIIIGIVIRKVHLKRKNKKE